MDGSTSRVHARNGGNQHVRIYLGDGNGGFTLLHIVPGGSSNTFELTDLNLDGELDPDRHGPYAGDVRVHGGARRWDFQNPMPTGVPQNGTNGNRTTPLRRRISTGTDGPTCCWGVTRYSSAQVSREERSARRKQ